MFKKYDTNNSGFLDVTETQKAITEVFLNEGQAPPNPSHVAVVMQAFDKNKNGHLDQNEFSELILKLNNII